MADDTTFAFPHEFQRSILQLLLSDREAMASLRDAMSPSYFQDETYRHVAESAFKVFDGAGGAHPSQASVLQASIDDCPGSLDPEEVEAAVRALYEDGAPEDAAYVRGQVSEFAKVQRLTAAAAEAEEMLAAGDADRWVEKVVAASVVGAFEQGDDMELFDDAREVITTLDELYGGALPTLTPVDEKLDGGGLCPGETGLVIALPGYHKTNLLINFGVGAIRQGKRVAHFAFEGGRRKVSTRYYCAMTKQTKSEVLFNPEETIAAVEALKEETGGSLRLSYYPKETCTLNMLEAKLKRWESFGGWRPDLIIVDYPALMVPAHSFDNTMRLQIASLYRGLERIGGVWGCPVWAALQSGREADPIMKAGGCINMRNAAESFEPCRGADVILTNNQTDEEKADGVLRIHGAKMRENESGWTLTVRVDAARSLILPLIEPLDQPEKPPEPEEEDV